MLLSVRFRGYGSEYMDSKTEKTKKAIIELLKDFGFEGGSDVPVKPKTIETDIGDFPMTLQEAKEKIISTATDIPCDEITIIEYTAKEHDIR